MGATDTIFGLDFDTDGGRLAAGSADGTLVLWELEQDDATLLARIEALPAGVYQVLFRPSDRIFGGGAVGHVSSWASEVEPARELVCRVTGTPISEEEWAQYVPGVDYDPPCA